MTDSSSAGAAEVDGESDVLVGLGVDGVDGVEVGEASETVWQRTSLRDRRVHVPLDGRRDLLRAVVVRGVTSQQ